MAVTHFVTIDAQNQHFNSLRNSWGRQLQAVFEGIAAPVWDAAPDATLNVLSSSNMHSKPMRVTLPAGMDTVTDSVPLQSVARQSQLKKQH